MTQQPWLTRALNRLGVPTPEAPTGRSFRDPEVSMQTLCSCWPCRVSLMVFPASGGTSASGPQSCHPETLPKPGGPCALGDLPLGRPGGMNCWLPVLPLSPRPPMGPGSQGSFLGRPISPQALAPAGTGQMQLVSLTRGRHRLPKVMLPVDGLGVSPPRRRQHLGQMRGTGPSELSKPQQPEQRRGQAREAAQASRTRVLLQERTAQAGQVRGRGFKPKVRHGSHTASAPLARLLLLGSPAFRAQGSAQTRGLNGSKSPLLWERQVGKRPAGPVSFSPPQGRRCSEPLTGTAPTGVPALRCLSSVGPQQVPPGQGEHRRSSQCPERAGDSRDPSGLGSPLGWTDSDWIPRTTRCPALPSRGGRPG